MQRNTLPIANLYFKFLHYDHAGNGYQETQLTNKYQEIVVDEIVKQIIKYQDQHIQLMKVSEESRTFVPYYDSIIERELRGDLCRIKMNPLTKAKVNN
jgi:hypothetical protein